MNYTFHMIGNAHLDPVWLWDAHEGLSEGVQTCRTVCAMMEADSELTFIRGEVAVYEHIEKTDPILFEHIHALVKVGRWDVVGGTYVQPDTNLPATETHLRHFLRGRTYFQSRLGVRPTVAWSADAFGQSASLPDILAAAGMDGYAFTRPFPDQMPLDCPAFWWEGGGGSRVLTYRPPAGWYGSERDGIPAKLDETLKEAAHGCLENVGVFYGVGNHGGGPTLRQVADIRAWAATHREVRVVFSGLHRLFAAVRGEIAGRADDSIRTIKGEIGLCLRGCYASAAKVKFSYRKMEALVSRAETTDTVLAPALGRTPADLSAAWDAVLLNSFHDILPGTSIERALGYQLDQMAAARYQARSFEFDALCRLANAVDTTVPPVDGDYPTAIPLLIWNPHPFPIHGPLALEVALDTRPVWSYVGCPDAVPLEVRGPDGAALPFQRVETEHNYMPDFPFRARVVAAVDLPPLGWAVYTLGCVEGAEQPASNSGAFVDGENTISNELYSVTASVGETAIAIMRNGVPLLGAPGLSAITVEDPYGSWGSMSEAPESLELSSVRDRWTVKAVRILESGPERAKLWARLTGGSSWLDLTFTTLRGRDALDVEARALWNERAARLKLVMPTSGETAEFEIPGGSITRGCIGEVPGGKWVRTETFGFASDALYGFDLKDGALRATVCRASRYASDVTLGSEEEQWRPAIDAGELKFKFMLTAPDADLSRLSSVLAQPPIVLPVPASSGRLPRSGSLAAIEPEGLTLLALKPSVDGTVTILRVQGGSAETSATILWQGETLSLGTVGAGEIATRLIRRSGIGWVMERVNAVEETIEGR